MKNSILKIQDFEILSKEELQKKVGGFNQCIEWFCCEPNDDGTCGHWSYYCNFYSTYCR